MSLDAAILAKIAAGSLPPPPKTPGKAWVGFGSGRFCDACDEAIGAKDVETEVDIEGRTVRFHAKCLGAWYGSVQPS